MQNCLTCGSGIDEYDSGYYARNMLCIPCYNRKASEVPSVSCGKCGRRIRQDEARGRRGAYYCSGCFSEIEREEGLPTCPLCKKRIEYWQESLKLSNADLVHASCAEKQQKRSLRAYCSFCKKEVDLFKVLPNSRIICVKCDRAGAASAARGHDSTMLASLVDRIGAMIG